MLLTVRLYMTKFHWTVDKLPLFTDTMTVIDCFEFCDGLRNPHLAHFEIYAALYSVPTFVFALKTREEEIFDVVGKDNYY